MKLDSPIAWLWQQLDTTLPTNQVADLKQGFAAYQKRYHLWRAVERAKQRVALATHTNARIDHIQRLRSRQSKAEARLAAYEATYEEQSNNNLFKSSTVN